MKRKRISWIGSDIRKRKALSKALKVVLNTSDKNSDVNIVDMPTDGQASGCHQLSVPAKFPAGEEDSNPDTAIETSYHMPRQASEPRNRCGCCGRAAIEQVGSHHVCNGGKCWIWAKAQLNKTAEFGQGLTQLTTEQETGKVKQKLTEPARWNESYHDDNQFEDKDLKLGESEPDDTDPLSSSVYPPYTDGIGQPNPRYEDASPKQRNIILHAAEDQEAIDPNQGPRQFWVAVDLDGTILEPPTNGIYQDPSGQHCFGNPLPGAREALQKLVDQGIRISIYTARQYFTHNDAEENVLRDAVKEVLDQHQIHYSDIYMGKKLPAHCYVDDRNISFDGDWEDALENILSRMDKVASGEITIDDIELIYEYYYKISRLEDKKVEEGLSEEGAANIREISVVLSKLLKLAIDFMKNKVYIPWMKSTSAPDQTAIPAVNAARHQVAATLRELTPTGNVHRDMAIFSQALNTAHSSGSMMDFLSHWYNINPEMLSALTSGEGYTDRWDRDIKRIAGEDFGIHDIEMIYEMFYKISKLEDQQTEKGISERGAATLTEMKSILSQLLRKAIVFLRDGVYGRWLETRGREATDRLVVDRIQTVAKTLVPSGDINRDIILFGNALNVVHQTGPMVEFVERWYRISALALEGLSLGRGYTDRWDREIKRIAEDDKVKDQVNYRGIKIDIEWPKGSIRSYEGDDTYVTHMLASYGYIRNVQGVDSDSLDVYLGDKDSDKVFIVEQLDADGNFDEQKLMIGFDSEEEAAGMYLEHLPAYMLGDISEIPLDKLVNALYGEPEDRRGDLDLVPSEEQ